MILEKVYWESKRLRNEGLSDIEIESNLRREDISERNLRAGYSVALGGKFYIEATDRPIGWTLEEERRELVEEIAEKRSLEVVSSLMGLRLQGEGIKIEIEPNRVYVKEGIDDEGTRELAELVAKKVFKPKT